MYTVPPIHIEYFLQILSNMSIVGDLEHTFFRAIDREKVRDVRFGIKGFIAPEEKYKNLLSH